MTKRGAYLDSYRGLNSFSHEKRGMSPLIATVLLIAFAVALGAMIMNWSSTFGEDTGPDCSKVSMIISPYICYAENIIKLSVKNTGAIVEGVTIRVVDESVENEIRLKDSRLRSGKTLTREIPFAKSGKAYVALTPSVKYKNEPVDCPEPVIEIANLPNC